jgi:hypothetical protein
MAIAEMESEFAVKDVVTVPLRRTSSGARLAAVSVTTKFVVDVAAPSLTVNWNVSVVLASNVLIADEFGRNSNSPVAFFTYSVP